MNYYEHHIGDYAEATAHLSFIEDAAYARCIRKYYSSEQPLPADLKAVQRLVGARTREERQAVETVLREFFTLEVDGWHNRRCDEELEKYREGEPERRLKLVNEKSRLRKHREERSRLFADLNTANQYPAWNVSMSELRQLHTRFCNATATRTETFHETETATPATAIHSQAPFPSAKRHTPSTKISESDSESGPPIQPHTSAHAASYAGARVRAGGGDDSSADTNSTDTLIAAGLNPSRMSAYLTAWTRDGITTERLLAAIAIAKDRKQADTVPAKYLDAVVRDESNFRHLARSNGVNGVNGKHHETAEQIENRIIEDAIRRGLTDAEIVRIADLQVAPDLHARIDGKRQEVSRAEH